ncbi:hypothetical protein LWI29_006683 [Acer saccharum]|uniref:UDP-glycosyltransferases domain-containing protein n=1 Tax=Acer saccharum TaxID=4024 RepID=A0AA39RC15_ACESA|nr:hypothetical protein LWI29_006683 [Acer saccharum]
MVCSHAGPALLYDDEINGNHFKSPLSANYLDWLDDHITKPASVIYISFGTQAHLSGADLDEIGFGLEMSGHEILWVIKSKTWCPKDGLEERVKGKGLMVRGWVEQRRVLAHPAVGGFLSHCGWNSVLESLSMGVPLLAFPMNAEQPLNAKQEVNELKGGLRVEMGGPSGWGKQSIQRHSISNGVRELMGENGKKVRIKAEELGRAARQAVKEGRTSYNSMTELINKLCARHAGVSS